MPGQPSVHLDAGEKFPALWRVRYECHAPATPVIFGQGVTVSATHTAGTEPDLSNNAASAYKIVIVR